MKILVAGAALIFLFACQTPNPDPFVPAKEYLEDGDLLQTIYHLDRVPPAHPQYAEARALAKAVERRMRTSQRLMTQGMEMRAEWRDDEAISFFEQAREVWPRIVGADVLIEATRNRISALEPEAPASLGEVATGKTTLIGFPQRGTDEPEVAEAEPSTERPSKPVPVDPLAGVTVPEVLPSAVPSKPLVEVAKPHANTGPRLQTAQRMLQRGQLERALAVMEDLFAEDAKDKRIRAALIRVLHHRALLSYGQGDLKLAVADWSRVLELDSAHKEAAEFHAAASAEDKIVNRRR